MIEVKQRPEISAHQGSCSHVIEGLLELAMPDDGLPLNEDEIDTQDILNSISHRITKLLSLSSYAFLLVDDDFDFKLSHCCPSEDKSHYQALADQWVEDGIFSWALGQNRALLLESNDNEQHILHVLATRTKVSGMFIGVAGKDSQLDEGSLALLSVILMHCANSLEKHELHLKLQRHASSLEAQVYERTRQLEIAKTKAEDAAKQKSAFLATMSHEIRTPMNGVIGMAQMLKKTSLDAEQQEYTRIISQSGQSLVLLINDILDFSKIEAGKLRLDPHPTDLHQLCRDVVTLLKPQADDKGISIKFPHAEFGPLNVIGDSNRLRQILTNLVGNAIKFTDEGSVGIHITTTTTHNNHIKILLSVKDTGIGISHEKQGQLFQPFSQLHSPQQETQKGTGLGLAICKQLIEMMGGEIGIHSAPGKGSSFWINVELEAANKGCADAKTADVGVPLEQLNNTHFQGKILVAEDNPVNKKVIQLMLQSMGLRSKIVEHGQAALDALQHSKYDLVFMDCLMPVMDGYTATQQIRSGAGPNSRVPIIALSANALEEDQQRCLEVGMDDFIAKPIDERKLIQTLAKWLEVDIGDKNSTEAPVGEIEIPAPVTIDVKRLSYLKTLSSEQFKELVGSFLEHTSERLEDLRRAVEAGNIDSAKNIVHAMKGSSATFGAQSFFERSTQIDTLAKHGELAEIRAQLGAFERCFTSTRNEIRNFMDA